MPRDLKAGLSLRPYQRQSVAFMLQQEKSNDASLVGSNGARGGPFGGPKFSDAAVPTDADVEPCMHMELEGWNP